MSLSARSVPAISDMKLPSSNQCLIQRTLRHGWKPLLATAILASCFGQSCNVSNVPLVSAGDTAEQILDSRPEPPSITGDSTSTLTASAGADQVAYEGDEVVLDASASTGASGALHFTWEQIDGAPVQLTNRNSATARFLTPTLESDATLTFRLSVTDGERSATDTVHVQVLHTTQPASAHERLQVIASGSDGDAPLSLDFQAATLDGTPLPEASYAWSFGDDTGAEGPSAKHVFTTPGIYVVTLCATFGAGLSATTACSEKSITARTPTVSAAGSGGGGGGGGGGGTPSTLTISGTVRNGGAGVASVSVSGTNGASTSVTNASGVYQVTVPAGWSGILTPSNAAYTYAPATRSYSALAVNQTAQDFTATPITVNHAPTATAGSASTNQGAAVLITLSGTDSDAQSLTFSVVTAPAHGSLGAVSSLTATSARVTYTPAAGYAGSDSFTFRASDGALNSVAATMSITVNAANQAPTAAPQSVFVQVNNPKMILLTGSAPDNNPLTFVVLTQPGHGTLSGTSPSLTYTPASGFQGTDSFTFRTSDGTANSAPATVSISVSGWVPPIGIPAPPFGITESHTMYVGKQYDYGSGPQPYKDAGSGPYTHYVDNTHPQATDAGNTYGTPAKPRLTIPTNLPAGSVVEIHGGPYRNGNGWMAITGRGTSTAPIFFRGIGAPAMSWSSGVNSQGFFENTYIIIEGLEFKGLTVNAPSSYICVRNCVMRNLEGGAGGGGVGVYSSEHTAHHIVYYNNTFGPNGDLNATFDQDCHGFSCNAGSYIWILDSQFFHNSGDGVQANNCDHVYIGRNVAWENKQTGFWTKTGTDMILSQNTVHGMRVSNSSNGEAMGCQYGAKRVWFIFNHLYNCDRGIAQTSANAAVDADIYAVGNVIHDITNDAIVSSPATNWHIVNNTIRNAGKGISNYSFSAFYIENNIISGITGESIHVEFSAASTLSTLKNCLLPAGCTLAWNGGVTTLALLQSTMGKGQNTVEADPLFVDPGANDLRVQPASQAVGQGGASDVYDTFMGFYGIDIRVDFDGTPRPASGADIGAYER